MKVLVILLVVMLATCCFYDYKSTYRATIIHSVSIALVAAIIYMFYENLFCWRDYCSTTTNIARNVGCVLGCSFVVGLPAWICVVICVILGIKKHIKIMIKNKCDMESFCAVALEEIEKNNVDKICWGKALMKACGNEGYARSLYIKLRVKKLLKQKNEDAEK